MSTFFKSCFNFISFSFYLLPRKLLRSLGLLLGVLWFDVFRFRRKVVMSNLDIAFPEKSKSEKTKIGRRSVYELGSNFAEFFVLPQLTQNWVKKNAVYDGVENIQSALAQGRGVYLLSMHVGHGDMGASLISMLGINVTLISKFFKTKWFNDFWFYIRKGQGVKFIEPHGRQTPFEILKVIKNKESVIFVLDQFMGKPYGVETQFFGKKTGTAYGLALFYLKTKSPVVPVYTYEGQDGKVHLVFEPELQLSSLISEDKEKSIALLTQNFTDQIEKIVRRYPEQWMWLHRRWKVFE